MAIVCFETELHFCNSKTVCDTLRVLERSNEVEVESNGAMNAIHVTFMTS